MIETHIDPVNNQVPIAAAFSRVALIVFCLPQIHQRLRHVLRSISLSAAIKISSIAEHYSIRFTRVVQQPGRGPHSLGWAASGK